MKEGNILKYFLLVMKNNLPVENLDSFLAEYDVSVIVEELIKNEGNTWKDNDYTASLLSFEVEDDFIDLIFFLTDVPGLLILESLDDSEGLPS